MSSISIMSEQSLERNRRAKALERFDLNNETLIDYFLILGPNED